MYLAGLYAKGLERAGKAGSMPSTAGRRKRPGRGKDLKLCITHPPYREIPMQSYELAKMFRDGTGTVKSAEQAEEHFQDAFSGFLGSEGSRAMTTNSSIARGR